MAKIILSPRIREKLNDDRHAVSEREIHECFANRIHGFLIDDREDHRTDPPTKWFVAETDYGRKLKIVFVQRPEGIYIKSAYRANPTYISMYNSAFEGK